MLSQLLLSTKIQVPQLRSPLVPRVRLVEKLELGFRSGGQLAMICAPAGYGKTTLALEWLKQAQQRESLRVAWLTLEESDNDPGRFFTCLVTALQDLEPQSGMRTLSLLTVPQMPPVEVLMGELINEMSVIEQPFLLALDDYHAIHTPVIHDAVEFLLQHLPLVLRVLLITREDPPFPLSRLRVRGQLIEIRARDLRFTRDEIQEFLQQVHRLSLSQVEVERLEEMTEGWAAGLQLAGLAVINEPDAASFLDSFNGTHQYIIEYLMDEVLRRQPEEIRHFLAATSILDRLNVDLCAALVGDATASRALLDTLERANLFITSLDSRREWFRYHRLFADILRAGLDPQEEARLHERAASWFEAHGERAEAIQHYLAAGATSSAGRLVRALAGDLVRHGEIQTLLKWTRALPPEEVCADSTLPAYQALVLMLTGDLAGSSALLELVQDLAPGLAGRGACKAVRAWMQLVSGKHAGIQAMAQQALDELPEDAAIFRTLALLVLGDSYFGENRFIASTEAYDAAYQSGLRSGHPFAALAGLTNVAFNLYDLGQMRRAIALCQDAQARFTDPRGYPLPILGMIDVPLAAMYLEQRDFQQAVAYASRGRELCQKLFSSAMMGGDAEVVLAQTAFLQERREEAYQILSEMRAFAIQHGVSAVEDKMSVAEADLHLREGDLISARACLERLTLRNHGLVPMAAFSLKVLQGEISLAEGQPLRALDVLAPLEAGYRQEGNPRRMIRLLGVKAAALQAAGLKADALAAAREAVCLAAPEGYLSALMRSMPVDLLIAVRSAAPEFVDQAFSLMSSPHGEIPGTESAPKSMSGFPALVEPLSDQERKILRLLTAGCSNQEIAAELVISTGTVKWHVHNILGKLGVASRAQAAAKARELGLA